MNKRFWLVFAVALALVPFVMVGCKGKVEKPAEEVKTEATETPVVTEEAQVVQTTEPAQTVATETIPPTAAPQPVVEKPAVPVQEKSADKGKDIQKALKNSGFYSGTIDGKIGPKTKKAIEEFQKAKGLKADGKVGPKTWAELEKYLK